jgi:hypothetical protein
MRYKFAIQLCRLFCLKRNTPTTPKFNLLLYNRKKNRNIVFLFSFFFMKCNRVKLYTFTQCYAHHHKKTCCIIEICIYLYYFRRRPIEINWARRVVPDVSTKMPRQMIEQIERMHESFFKHFAT